MVTVIVRLHLHLPTNRSRAGVEHGDASATGRGQGPPVGAHLENLHPVFVLPGLGQVDRASGGEVVADDRTGRVERPSVGVQGEGGAVGVFEPRRATGRSGASTSHTKPQVEVGVRGVFMPLHAPHDRGEPAPVLAERDAVDPPAPTAGPIGLPRQWRERVGIEQDHRIAGRSGRRDGQGLTIGAEPHTAPYPIEPGRRSRLVLRQQGTGADVVQPDVVGARRRSRRCSRRGSRRRR